MDRLLRILLEHPYLILILAAWIGGAIANAAKAAKKARERAEAQRRTSPPPRSAPASPGGRTADEIAEEMRRILGMEGPVGRRGRPEPAAATPPAPPRERTERRPLRNVPESERPPTPVAPVTQARHLDLHAAPHVGDAIKERHLEAARGGARGRRTDLGTLGGRVQGAVRRRATGSRYALDDLKRAFVLSEILGPPLALRPPDAVRDA